MDTREWLRKQGEFDKDRAPPIHFAGREEELGTILRRSADPMPGNTIVVQGAPGAGKTALLREAAARFSASDRQALLYESPWKKAGEVNVLRKLSIASFGTDPSVFTTTETSSRSAQGKLFGIGGSLTKTEQKTPIEFRDWTDFLDRHEGLAHKARPVLVLVDESQNFENDAGELLAQLHTQSVFPFTLVCAGLANTKDKLDEIGISRVGNNAILQIVALTKAEAMESIGGALDRILKNKCLTPPIQYSEKDMEKWTVMLGNGSLGWPQHITSYLMGAWRSLAESKRLDLSEEQNLQTALGYGRQLCANYYEGRIESAKINPKVALAVHRALLDNESASHQGVVLAAIRTAVAELDSDSSRIHLRNHPDEFSCYERMLKAGIIEERDGYGNLGIPIPSMTLHLERIADFQHQANPKGVSGF